MHAPMPERYEPEEHSEFREVPRPVHEVAAHRDIVRWGPILGGTFAAIAIMVVLTVLGLLFGLAAVGPAGTITTPLTTLWAIWAAVSMIIAFFLGGWLAARTSAFSGTFSGVLDGSLVWATTLLLALFLTGFGAVSALGPLFGQFTLFGITSPLPPGITIDFTASALWTLLGLVVSYVAAVVGGLLGSSQEAETTVR